MKPFDLEKAKAGEPICTAGGDAMFFVAVNPRADKECQLVLTDEHGVLWEYSLDGIYCHDGCCYNHLDLHMAPKPKVKRERWVYLMNDNPLLNESKRTREDAEQMALKFGGTAVRLEWEAEA